MSTTGVRYKNMVSGVPANLQTERAKLLQQTLKCFPEEAVYVYSFIENRMIYAAGWEDVLGYRDDEINLLTILNSTTPEFVPFADDLNEKALHFIQTKTTDLDKYSFMIEIKKAHKDGTSVPLIVKVGVFTVAGGRVTEIIGRNQVSKSIRFGHVMRYAAYGPEKSKFEEELNKQLFHYHAISQKEKDALELVASGYSFKEIANQFQVSQSAIEKRIIPMYKRFNVKSLTHLISFAYDNHILIR